MLAADTVHVAAGVLKDRKGRILLAQRAAQTHQGGLWEFPGGKVEPGEGVQEALRREWREELGVEILESAPLIRVWHQYEDRCVLLDTWSVERYDGQPRGLEGQPLVWAAAGELESIPMPAADRPILTTLRLPAELIIESVPGAGSETSAWTVRGADCHHPAQSLALHRAAARSADSASGRGGVEWVAGLLQNPADAKWSRSREFDFIVFRPDEPQGDWSGLAEFQHQTAVPVYLSDITGRLTPSRAREWGAQGTAQLFES